MPDKPLSQPEIKELASQYQIRGTQARLVRMDETEEGTQPGDDRRFQLTFSSEEPVKRYDWYEDEYYLEVLSHKEGHVDLSRLNANAPLLKNHRDARGVVESAWVKDGKGYAIVRFSANEYAKDDLRDVQDGIICNVSVGYNITQRNLQTEAEGQLSIYSCHWTPMEVSVLSVPPADITVGIGRDEPQISPDTPQYNFYQRMLQNIPATTLRSQSIMADIETVDETQKSTEAAPPTPAAQRDEESIRRRVLEDEKKRRQQINELHQQIARNYNMPDDFLKRHLDNPDLTVEDYRRSLYQVFAQGEPPTPTMADTRVEAGESWQEKFNRGAADGLLIQAGHLEDDPNNEFRNLSIKELARHLAVQAGIAQAHSMPATQLAMKVWGIRTGFHTTSDFAALVANVANKALLKGYRQSSSKIMKIVSMGNNPDFKPATLIGMSEFGLLKKRREGGEINFQSLRDTSEKTIVKSWDAGIRLGRDLIINDDQGLLTTVPLKLGQASIMTREQEVINVLTSLSIALSDNVPIFHADHNNLAASGGAIGDTTLTAGKIAMKKQKGYGDTGKALNIRPRYLVVPVVLEVTARRWMTNTYQPIADNQNPIENDHINSFEVIDDARLDDISTTAWYFTADPERYDVIEMTTLTGQSSPVLVESQQYEGMVGMELVLFDDFAVNPLDYRGLYKNEGA